MKTNKKNDEALRHSKRPLHRGRGGEAMSTGAEQIHEYPWRFLLACGDQVRRKSFEVGQHFLASCLCTVKFTKTTELFARVTIKT